MEKQKCESPALFRYTWPGRDESFSCLEHSVGLQNIAQALGLHLQMIQVDQRKEIDKNNEIKQCESSKPLK